MTYFVKRTLMFRIIGLVMSLMMITGTLVVVPVFAEDEAKLLETQVPDLPTEFDESNGIVAMGTVGSEVDENGKYIVTVYRQGNTENEQSVKLKTVDISAKYGEDYIISDKNYDTTQLEQEKTIVQENADFKKEIETLEEDQDSQNTSEGDADLEQSQDVAGADDTSEADDDYAISELAKLKEAQTGNATRETQSTPMKSIQGKILDEMGIDLGKEVVTSSETNLVFMPGETEKQITIEILDDDKSEGDEVFDLILSEPSDGLILSDNVNCSIMIKDDEPSVTPVLNLSQGEYDAENGSVEIKVERSEAEYKMVTVMVRTVQDGDAVESVNYSKVDAQVQMQPYVNEQSFSIPVAADKDMSFGIELYDAKGAEIGNTSSAIVHIYGSNNDNVKLSEEQANLQSGDEMSFSIKLDNKDYTVRYKSGDVKGTIYDTSFMPEIAVGDYYFMNDGANGGNVEYRIYTGDKGYTRISNYEASLNRAKLYWFDWWGPSEGTSNCIIKRDGNNDFPINKYRYISANWEQTNNDSNSLVEMIVDFTDYASNSKSKRIAYSGFCDKAMSDKLVLMDEFYNKPIKKMGQLKFSAVDRTNWQPKTELYVYGFAAMYRKFNINLEQPSEMEYKKADGTTTLQKPANVMAGTGHETRHLGQDYAVTITSTDEGQPIKGELSGYYITTGTSSDKKKTFFYQTNSQTLKFDEEFVKLLDDNTNEYAMSNTDGYYTNLSIKPVFNYKNCSVEILENQYGSFDNTFLNQIGKATYHIGDEFSMSGTPNDAYKDSMYYSGFSIRSYKNPYDTQPEENSPNTLRDTLVLDKSKYVLKPVFTNIQNHIEIVFADQWAKDNFTVLGTIPDSQLPDYLKGKTILRTNVKTTESTDIISPEVGKVYQIQVLNKKEGDTSHRPVFKMSSNGTVVNGSILDFVAEPVTTDNVIEISSQAINEDDYKYFKLSGVATYEGVSIRDSGSANFKTPAINANIIAGAEETHLFNSKTQKVRLLDRISTQTDETGAYELVGIRAMSGDTISVFINNNDIQQVQYVTLNSEGAQQSQLTFIQKVVDDIKHTVTEKVVTKDGYVIANTLLGMPIKTPYSPYVRNVSYSYENQHKPEVDTRNNEIPIEDDMLFIKARVALQGRQVKSAVFIIRDSSGSEVSRKEVKADSDYQDEFTLVAKADKTFESGNKLYIELIDKEDMTVYYNTVNEETGQEEQISETKNKEYPEIYTGLSFYIPNVEVKNQVITATGLSKQSIPVLGDLSSKISTGTLNFERQYGKGGEHPPYENIVSLNVSSADFKTNKEALSKYRNDETVEASESVEDQVKNYDVESYINALEESTESSFTDAKKEELTNNKKEEIRQQAKSAAAEKSKAELSKSKITVNVMVMLAFQYSYSSEKNEYVFAGGQYLIGGSLNYKKAWYWSVYGVPVYISLNGIISVQFDGRYKTENGSVLTASELNNKEDLSEVLKSEDGFEIGGKLKVMPGVGICGVIGARGIIDINILYRYTNIKDQGSSPAPNSTATPSKSSFPKDGFMFNLKGGIGIDLLLFSVEFEENVATVGYGIYAKKSNEASLAENTEPTIVINSRGDTIDRTQDEAVSLSDFGSEQVKSEVMMENTISRTKPQLVKLDDGRTLFVYLTDDKTKNDLNASTLAYSIKGTDGKWSESKFIENNGFGDSSPALLKVGNKVYISWTSVDKEFDNSADPKEVLQNMNIYMSVYDSISDTFGEVYQVTNDDTFEDGYSMLSTNGENVEVTYYKRDLSNVEQSELASETASYSTLASKIFNTQTNELGDEKFIEIVHPTLVDPLVNDYNRITSKIGDKEFSLSTYTVDLDGDKETEDDKNVWLKLNNLTDNIDYYPVKISELGNVSRPKVSDLNGEIYLTWVENGNEIKTINITDIYDGLVEDGSISAYKNVQPSDSNWYLEAANGSNEFSLINLVSDIKNITNTKSFTVDKNDSDSKSNITNYSIVKGKDGNLYLIWTDTGSGSGESNSIELYGSTMQYYDEPDDSKTNKPSNWGDAVKLTNFNKVIDENSVDIDENSVLTVVSNQFEQTIGEDGKVKYGPNNLVCTYIKPISYLNIDEYGIKLEDKYPKVGEDESVSVEVKNDGLNQSSDYKVVLSEEQNGIRKVVGEQEGTKTLYSGDVDTIDFAWKVPDNLENLKLVAEIVDTATGEVVSTMDQEIELRADINIENPLPDITDDNQNYHYTGTIRNDGSASADDMTLTIKKIMNDGEGSKNGKVLLSKKLDPLAPGEKRDLDELLDIEQSDFNGYNMVDMSVIIRNGEDVVYESSESLYDEQYDVVMNDEDKNISLKKGETYNVHATAYGIKAKDEDLIYASANNNVVTIKEDGTITAVNPGKTMVMAYNSFGFDISQVTVTGSSNNNNSSGSGNSGYSTDSTSTPMPNVTASPNPTTNPIQWVNPYSDVSQNDWYYDYVKYVTEMGIMNGVENDKFAPDDSITRGMIATILYRMENQPETELSGFSDVEPSEYYAKAIGWASKNGIVKGYSDEEFGPNKFISREEAATMIFRYVKSIGKGPVDGWAIRLDYSDLDQISDYAMEAVMYCTMSKIMEGKENNLFAPQDLMTRAESAAVMNRIVK